MSVMPPLSAGEVEIAYVNWRGQSEIRRIRPIEIWWGITEWHPKHQYFLRAWCCERRAQRDFAMADIRSWSNAADAA